MNVVFVCPECGQRAVATSVEQGEAFPCSQCGSQLAVPAAAIVPSEADGPPRLTRCLVCPSTELFVRKNFPQRLGVGIVVAGLGLSCVSWAYHELLITFAILFSTALLDVMLFFLVPECLTCYRCGARYTGPGITERFGGFNLETHEKYRQQAARRGQSSAAASGE
jgi:ribosomal protein L37AE/L43A